MRGSCSGSAPELDLSRAAQPVAQVERAQAVEGAVREVREPSVDAVELLTGGPLVGLLDAELALLQRLARELEDAVPAAALGLLEQGDIDLGREHLVRAAHVAGAAERVVVRVEGGALLPHAGGGLDHTVAVRQALAALRDLGAA